MRRLPVALLTAMVAVSTAGCDTADTTQDSPPTTVAPSTSLPPAEQLAASVRPLTATSYRYSLLLARRGVTSFADTDQAVETTGRVDPTARKVSATTSFKSKKVNYSMELRTVDGGHYVKFAGTDATGTEPGAWLRIDLGRLTLPWLLALANTTDPSGAASLIKAVVTAQRTTPRTFTGTFDLTKTEGFIASPTQITELGDTARSVPFEATLDDQYRLASITVPSPYAKPTDPATYVFTISHYRDPIDVVAPPADQTKTAPDSVYDSFND